MDDKIQQYACIDGIYFLTIRRFDVFALYQSRKVDTKNNIIQKVFSKVDIQAIFHQNSFSKVDTGNIFHEYLFSKVDTVEQRCETRVFSRGLHNWPLSHRKLKVDTAYCHFSASLRF